MSNKLPGAAAAGRTSAMGGPHGMEGELLGTKEMRIFEASVWNGQLSTSGCP